MKTDITTSRPTRATLALSLCAGLALLGLSATAQDPAPGDEPTVAELAERVEELEQKLAAETGRVTALGDDLAALAGWVDETVAYLQAQAKSAEAMAKVLETSEAEGFTYGINPRSREVLLAGWRDRLRDIRTGVPGVEKEQPAPAPTPPARSGGQR